MHVFRQWEEAEVPRENPRIQGENMQTPHMNIQHCKLYISLLRNMEMYQCSLDFTKLHALNSFVQIWQSAFSPEVLPHNQRWSGLHCTCSTTVELLALQYQAGQLSGFF